MFMAVKLNLETKNLTEYTLELEPHLAHYTFWGILFISSREIIKWQQLAMLFRYTTKSKRKSPETDDARSKNRKVCL